MQRLLLKNKVRVWLSEELLEQLLPVKGVTLSRDAFFVGTETDAPPKRRQGKAAAGEVSGRRVCSQTFP